jgi:hypothetical protein
MSQEAHDEAGSNAKLTLSPIASSAEARNYRLEWHPTTCVRLGVKENLSVSDAVTVRCCEIFPAERLEIVLGYKCGHGAVVALEKVLEIVKVLVSPFESFWRRV